MKGLHAELTTGVLEGLSGLSRLDAATRELASAPLGDVPDDLLQDMRRALSLLGPEAWRALAAVDYELVERARKRPHPAGRPDLGGGHARRVSSLARSLGTVRRVMTLNAEAHRLSLLPHVRPDGQQGVLGDVLSRPEYYHCALRWTDPAAQLRAWAHLVERGERVTVNGPPRRTLALVTETGPTASHGPQCAPCRAVAHIQRTLETFRTLIIPDVPAPIWTARLYLDWLEELNETLSDLEGHAPSAS